MCQIAHVAVHTAIVSRVLARLERLIARVRAHLFEDASQDGVRQSLRLVGAMVCRVGVVVACAELFVFGRLLAAELLHEPHDAVREGPWWQLEGVIDEGRGRADLICR